MSRRAEHLPGAGAVAAGARPPSRELGLAALVVNQGSHSDRNSTRPAAMPMYSPGDSRDSVEVAAPPLSARGFHRAQPYMPG